MTHHRNLTKTLLVLGISACVSTLPAQNTPQNTPATSGQSRGQTAGPDRQSTRSGSDTTDRNSRSNQTSTPANTTSGDRTHAQQGSDTANRNRAGETETMVGQADLKFMNETAQSGLMEVKAATLAEQKSQNPEVKKFAQQLVEDHSKANKELEALAKQKNVNLPTEMGPKHQQQITKLENLSDAQFDRQWTKMQVDHHKKDVKEFQKQASRSMDSHVKEFAEKTLPTLQQHLQTAQGLQQTGTRSRSADAPSSSGSSGAGSTSDTKRTNDRDTTQRPQGQDNPAPQR
jgi:putative membrane protein